MAVSPHISPTLSRYKFFPTSIPNFSPYHHTYSRRSVTISHLQAHNSTTSYGRTELASSKKLWIRQRSSSEMDVEQAPLEEDEEEEEETDIGDEASLLSLSMKPDRNMALLDDYEMEELGHTPDTNHRSGYVAVLGMPNVGKSTLSNQMIGQKISIVTDKPQTTRHRILGICSSPEYQMILYDTPGVIEKKMHRLDTMMMKNVRDAAINADFVVILVDACKMPAKIEEVLKEGLGDLEKRPPMLLVINKKDLIKPGEIAKKLEEGKALKTLATAARLDIEDFLQKKVFLEVEVKVKENWRQDEGLLKYYGYGGQIRAM